MVAPRGFHAAGCRARLICSGDVIGGRQGPCREDARGKIRPLSPAAAGHLHGRAWTASCASRPPASGWTCSTLAAASSSASPRHSPSTPGSASVKPQTDATLLEIARTVKTKNQTFVDVLAHTDTSGNPQGNQALVGEAGGRGCDLSRQRMAWPRTDRLARLWQIVPLYNPDTTETQKAANRRIEIRLVPYAANAAPRRRPATAPPTRPRRSRRARRAGDGRSAGVNIAAPCTTPPPFGSSAREPQRLRAAQSKCRAHIAHGSSVTHKVQSSSREVPSRVAAARIASISAWAVGSANRASRCGLRRRSRRRA